jgi:hypothetical protein
MKTPRLTPLELETTAHAAFRVGKSVDTIRFAISTGKLPAYTVQRGVGARHMHLVRPADVDRVFAPRPSDLPTVSPDELTLTA